MSHWVLGLVLGCTLPACSLLGDTTDAEAEALRARVVGTWRVVPQDGQLRRLRVIDAALSGRPDEKAALGDLTEDEHALFDEWAAKRGAPAENMKAELRFLDGAVLEFTEDQVTVRFGTDVFGPADYLVHEATEEGLLLRFDPGLGNGEERHEIEWTGPDRGIDRITSDRRGAFSPLVIRRR